MEQKTLPLGPGTARVWTAGDGEAIVLLHGPWAGAEAYWFKVADELALTHRIIAPELPGIGLPGALLPTFGAYAAWLDDLLDALDIDGATVVGNALGAAVAWRYAAQHPERCRGLVMVNGYPPPAYNRMVRWLAGRTVVRRLVRANFQRTVYGSAALGAAFHDRGKVPKAVAKALDHFSTAEIDAMLDLLLADEAPLPAPSMPALLLFGEADKMRPFDRRGAQRMGPSLADGRLVTIAAAGHMPQVEHPVAFVRAIRNFVGS
jgi:pimeloyl-ACP methyl ester carboxylesterase